ncbi:MAG: nickel-dependent lactate racemase [Nitrososphaerota archaeon]|nr:nickel-dependent lactate racemase [Nitrososphaerota archaeon]
MNVNLPYGKNRTLTVDVPDENIFFVVDRGYASALENPREELKRALRNPIGVEPLRELVNPRDKVVIVGDDNTRPTPQNVIVPALLDELNAAGVPDENIEVVIALGTHRKMSEKEIKEKYGGEVFERVAIINHDCKDPENLVDIGVSEIGIPVRVNREVYNADFVIGVGNIVPHPLAGWGGGGKIIFPGVCDEKTVAMTHFVASKVRPLSKLMGRLDNEIRKIIDRVAIKAGLKLIVNTVLNSEDRISYLAVGHPIAAFREGVKVAEKIFCPKIPGLADIVVVSSYPADIDYYQASKAVAYASLAVKQGGTMVLITPCYEGISPIHPIIREKAKLNYDEILKAVENNEIEDLVSVAVLFTHAQSVEKAEVICYSEGLTEEDKNALGFKHANTVEEAIKLAFESQGGNAKVGVLKCGEILPMTK